MRVGLTYDLKDDYRALGFDESQLAEFDSQATIDGLSAAITALGHECVRIGHVRALAARLVAGETWDLVFNVAEGVAGFGRESQVPALLDAWGIPYTFSDPLVCALTLHKAIAKQIARAHGIATPDFAVIETEQDIADIDLPLPLFAKPVAEGTSKGIDGTSLITSRAALTERCRQLLHTHAQPVLVERFLPGREFTVGILGTGTQARVLTVMEIVLRASAEQKVYTYRNKEHWQKHVEYRLLDAGKLFGDIEALALATWRSLGCRDAGRVDVRLDETGRPQLIEVNPLAGLTPGHSDLPIMASLLGMEYPQLIGEILDSTLERLAVPCRRSDAA